MKYKLLSDKNACVMENYSSISNGHIFIASRQMVMAELIILNETELRQAVQVDRFATDCIEIACCLLPTAEVFMPPIVSFHVLNDNGRVCGWTSDQGRFGYDLSGAYEGHSDRNTCSNPCLKCGCRHHFTR